MPVAGGVTKAAPDFQATRVGLLDVAIRAQFRTEQRLSAGLGIGEGRNTSRSDGVGGRAVFKQQSILLKTEDCCRLTTLKVLPLQRQFLDEGCCS
jgi:hypothetical protein